MSDPRTSRSSGLFFKSTALPYKSRGLNMALLKLLTAFIFIDSFESSDQMVNDLVILLGSDKSS